LSFPEDDAPEGHGSSPEDVAVAARGCQAILVIVFIIVQQF
jgi:hypothetical protein